MITRDTIYAETLNQVTEHIDPLTGEINLTFLAESVCGTLNGYDGDNIPEVYFEAALEAADYYSQRH